jgi:DNA adenine methylase
MNRAAYPHPILKWVGGKTQIIDKLMCEFPTEEINNYREIFLGGGSVLFAFLHSLRTGSIRMRGNIYAYDVNAPLIYVYKNIQTNHEELYAAIQKLIQHKNECATLEEGQKANRKPSTLEEAKSSVESYYYWIRAEYNRLSPENKQSIYGSALFIFLNKMCFRGVFRVGPKGFNVPYGHYANPEIINREHLAEIHELIQPVIFEAMDFTESIVRMEPGDYAYLDPPYAPETAKSFVGYTENGFSAETHNQLFQLIHRITGERKVKKIMMSNADVDFVRSQFVAPIYSVHSLVCKRCINSKAPDAKAREVIVKNY